MELEPLDQQLLNALQAGLPLCDDPFAEIAAGLGADPDDAVARIRRLKGQKVIRQISAIFDTVALGYRSCLVAARLAPALLDEAAAMINRHPGVTHNYQRNHEFNLWFTVAVPPDSRLGLERTIELLGAESGATVIRPMPSLRVFKIGVKLDMSLPDDLGAPGGAAAEPESLGREDEPVYAEADRARAADVPLTDADKTMIRLLQEDLPVTRWPFRRVAEQGGCRVEELLDAARRFQDTGRMRRFAAVLHHRQAGYSANAMGVWSVPDEQVERVGRQLASFKAVSHCYLRPTWPDWPYNIFTMVHGRSREQCNAELAAMQKAVGVERMDMLYSLQEYKKVRLRYFTGEVERWEAERL